MLPGKKYRPEDLLLIARRRMWLIATSVVLCSTVAFVVSKIMPNRYRADVTLEVVPQRVAPTYVRPTVTIDVENRLTAIEQRVRSRTWLEQVIREFNLYPDLRKRDHFEDAIVRMRDDIDVDVIRGDVFRLSYSSGDPKTAMVVTSRLAALVIDASTQDRAGYADSTTEFLKSQLDEAARQLSEQEQIVAAYQRLHAGALPSERQSNLQVLQSLQMQVQAVVESINRDRDRTNLLERSVADLRSEARAAATRAPARTTEDPATGLVGGPPAAQLEAAKAALAGLQRRFSDEHPDVKRLKRLINELEVKVQAEALGQSPPAPVPPAAESAEDAVRRGRIYAVQTELDDLGLQIKSKEATEVRLRNEIRNYQGRVLATPLREADLTSLTREYEVRKRHYESLQARYEDARVAGRMEHLDIGEQFKVLDAAQLPRAPVSPNRLMNMLLGVLAGFGVGIGLTAVLESRDKSLRGEEDVQLCLALPVLALVPEVVSRADRRKWWKKWAVGSSAVGFCVTAAIVLWKLGWLTGLVGR